MIAGKNISRRAKLQNIDYKRLVLKIILITIAILYISFLYIDITGVKLFISSDEIKYICIILCFTISLLIGKDCMTKEDRNLLQLGLFFTVIADLFLLVYSYHTLGVFIFCIAQTFYSIRYDNANAYQTIRKYLSILLIIIITYLIVNSFIIEVEFLFTVAFFYAILLIVNVIKAIRACRRSLFPYPNKHMIAWGMILFLLCDINVALFNTIEKNNIPFILIWFFYLPSQVLLALSGWKRR